MHQAHLDPSEMCLLQHVSFSWNVTVQHGFQVKCPRNHMTHTCTVHGDLHVHVSAQNLNYKFLSMNASNFQPINPSMIWAVISIHSSNPTHWMNSLTWKTENTLLEQLNWFINRGDLGTYSVLEKVPYFISPHQLCIHCLYICRHGATVFPLKFWTLKSDHCSQLKHVIVHTCNCNGNIEFLFFFSRCQIT